ncbi:MAG: hypothetical protein HYR72_11705 [Deltaproteobacteria bacterium]|nr:hypothetical protein [Deltaproteobacteria bacterium]MBI3387629.1 hypothetical protein [Deltaproteobacteria bacterium]
MKALKPRTTLFDVVRIVQDHEPSDQRVVAILTELVTSGRLVFAPTSAEPTTITDLAA